MYRSILVPLDGSTFGEQALPLASGLAQRAAATLHLLHVYAPASSPQLPLDGLPSIAGEVPASERERVEAYLKHVGTHLSSSDNIVVTSAARDAGGSVVDSILAYASVTTTDVIVLTTHGRGGAQRFWLGSVTDGLARRSPVPLLIVRSQAGAHTPALGPSDAEVLIPLDGSRTAEAIVEHALRLGQLLAGSYTLLHVVVPMRLHEHSPHFTPIDLDSEGTEEQKTVARHYLDGVAGRLRADGARVRTLVVVAPSPAPAIIEAAQRGGALIALATHGRSGLRRLLLGSVADKVLRGAETPVLLYRPQAAEPRP